MTLYDAGIFIADELSHFGWQACDETSLAHFCGVATKWFDTGVGPKSGLIIMEPSNDGHQNLKAEYWSEGRNVLSTIVLKFQLKGDRNELAAALQSFAEEIEEYVGQSYAVRLLHNGT